MRLDHSCGGSGIWLIGSGAQLRQSHDGVQLVEHFEADDGGVVFEHVCKLGLEGIVSKRRDASYQYGRSRAWLKIKNPESPAMQRVWEERL